MRNYELQDYIRTNIVDAGFVNDLIDVVSHLVASEIDDSIHYTDNTYTIYYLIELLGLHGKVSFQEMSNITGLGYRSTTLETLDEHVVDDYKQYIIQQMGEMDHDVKNYSTNVLEIYYALAA